MRTPKRLVAAGILAAGAFAPLRAEPLAKLPRETWMGVYVGGAKIGYLRSVTDRATYKGRPGYRLDSFMRSRVVLLGTKLQQDVRTVLYTDDAFSPVHEEFEMSSGGQTTKIIATFTEKTVECDVVSETTSKKSIPIPEGAKLVGETMYGLEGKDVKVGDKYEMYYFNPLTLTVDKMTAEVLREEEVELQAQKHNTLVVRYATPLGELTCWQERDGEPVKVAAMMGMTMIRETREKALADEEAPNVEYAPPSDFAVLTSVKADKDIQNPSQVRQMKVRLVGIKARDLLISDGRQQAMPDWSTDPPIVVFSVSAKEFDAKRSAKLGVFPPGMDQYLAESPYIQVKETAIAQKAAEIVDGAESAYEAAKRIRAWVNKTVQPQASIGVPRSAADVLKRPVGVCRDYATLFTALARAARIPTRMVAGLVYMNGSFYYHAWAESFVGEWVPFDPTLPTDLVDATHIKFTEGDATSMFLMSKVIGTLKAEILEVH